MTWEITIKKVDNGYIVKHLHETIDEITETVFEESDNETETMIYLLTFIRNHFGLSYSKHNKQNVIIEIEETNK